MTKQRLAKLTTIAAALLVALLFTACGSGTKEIRLSASDASRHIVLRQGQVLVITLEANPSTGYSWEEAPSQATILRRVGEPVFEASSKSTGQLGAAGTETLRYEATGQGRMALKLVYHRPWEKDVEPLQTFSVDVEVQ
jgi:inhibitor of cysteine peptidase